MDKKSCEPIDYTGETFGRLYVIERAEDAVIKNGKHIVQYRCKCECGNEKIVRKMHLTRGAIISCGCFHREKLGNLRRKHGFSHKERLYSVWLDMKERCRNPKNGHYKSYGGRGISVCVEWQNDYLAFRNWAINNGYEERIGKNGRNDLTIDRINVDGDYEPDNCRFITNKENCLNKRNTMSDEERFRICPICGKRFEMKKRNEKKTCGTKCGHILQQMNRPIERKKDGTFKKHQLSENLCDEKES